MKKIFGHINYIKLFSIISLLIISSFTSFAQVNFYTTTDAKEVFQGSYIEVEFTVENAEGKKFTPPDFKGFRVISGPNTSSSYSIVNGISSSKKSYSYTLLATKPGIYTINPAKITVRKKTYKTKPITVKVLKKDQTKTTKKDNDIFAKIELSDSVVYAGQQIVLKYNLYTTRNISNYSFRSEPDLDGFRIIELNNNTRGIRKIIGNKEYTVFTLKKIALFPQKTGTFDIGPAYIVLQIPNKRSRNVFFRSTKAFPIYTNNTSILVKPLPGNAPDDFSGNTGKFKIYVKTDKSRVSTDDAFSLKLQIASDNPSKYIEAPQINEYLKDFEIYDPKVIGKKDFEQNGKLHSKKTFEYLIVPQKPGNYTLKIPFTYFDTDSSKYLTIYSNPINIKIIKGKNNQNAKMIIEKYKLRPLMSDLSLMKKKSPFFGSFSFWLILALLFSTLPLMYLYKRHLIKQRNIDPIILKRKKAAKIALKRLKVAKKYMDENKISAFYKEISDALLKYVADKLNIPTIELSKENVRTKLQSLNISQENIEEYIKLLETCEIALYAANPDKNMPEMYNKTAELLTKVEASM